MTEQRKSRTLIFPAGMPRALSYLAQARAENQDVIGASSLGYDPAQKQYPAWIHLPYITAENFDSALRQALIEHGITAIYTPNPVVWNYLQQKLAQLAPTVQLVNGSPVDSELAPYRSALTLAQQLGDDTLALASCDTPKPAGSILELAALFRHAETIPGMCDHDKIRALCAIARQTPDGDIIEIGSWWGKSAFVLLQLATIYRIGKLLCIDPWSNEHLVQHDEKGLVDSIAISADEAFTVFRLNLLPYGKGAVNYLRMPSVQAAAIYREQRELSSAEFGSSRYEGKISLLHIDGNHSLSSVQADLSAWVGHVCVGGWIIIDDYVWPYGDGPKRAADHLLLQNRQCIELAFVMGSALFIRLNQRIESNS
ncbi:class I SAM-dependent methyltransferase [Permianibacter sp. IMCC34836]|uniref:class I SAM-dependent methyltransferase n=1 Tax=Permianibacter fluminis TaxID=2738515 RepID=UPI0015551162|nr:class I SAM-dependent methyltransferase [Permianibacter fluminis]NQD38061.1 class I SAM-dependent methyltransferase [Permianibacter fluminis]